MGESHIGGASARIALIFDDDPGIRSIVSEVLVTMGLDVQIAQSLADLVQSAREGKSALIVTDFWGGAQMSLGQPDRRVVGRLGGLAPTVLMTGSVWAQHELPKVSESSGCCQNRSYLMIWKRQFKPAYGRTVRLNRIDTTTHAIACAIINWTGDHMSLQATDEAKTKPAWPVFMAKLRSRHEVAVGTIAFQFEKPSDWTFEAGQFIDMTLLKPAETDPEGNTRGFSIASAPFEDSLMIATRMRDTAFKRVLKVLPLGAEVKIEGPFGDLRLLNNAARPAVVLSGGIGITPFWSILMQVAKEKRPRRIVFFYANRRPEDAPFRTRCALWHVRTRRSRLSQP